ncbi:helix-turn-helix domain-containing protein [Reyranella sp.]|uniref:helix-turn-helix domain-containing protein n=1 Tax=Reyranella sp. TaxID=1929291 RepID=UPI00345D8996
MTLGAVAGQAELKRLSLAHHVLGQVAQSKHVDSRLPALIDLVLSRPLISADIAQRDLKLTSTGFRRLRLQLGTSVKKVTGRRRFQAWGIL